MSDVKRWDMEHNGAWPYDGGDWVRAEDYDTLKAENERLKTEKAKLRAEVKLLAIGIRGKDKLKSNLSKAVKCIKLLSSEYENVSSETMRRIADNFLKDIGGGE